MRKTVTLIALLLPLSEPLMAQDPNMPKFNVPLPPPHRILQMRYDAFTNWANKHNPNMNEVEQDAVAVYYGQLRDAENERALKRLPVSAASALKAAVKAVRAWEEARFSVMYAHEGGGTMYTHGSVRMDADLIETEADCIAGWYKSPTNVKTVALVKPFGNVAKQPSGEFFTARQYPELVRKEAAALSAARAAVARLPRRVQPRLLRFMADVADFNTPRD